MIRDPSEAWRRFGQLSSIFAFGLIALFSSQIGNGSATDLSGTDGGIVVAQAAGPACGQCRDQCVAQRQAGKGQCCLNNGGTPINGNNQCDNPTNTAGNVQCLEAVHAQESSCWDQCQPICDAGN